MTLVYPAPERTWSDHQADCAMYIMLAGCSLAKDPAHPGKNWVTKGGGLPDYICRIARAVMRSGHHTTGEAIAIAVGAVRNWAHGHGGKVHPQTRAKGAAAAGAWEALKAKAHARSLAEKASSSSSRLAASNSGYDFVQLCADSFPIDTVTSAFRKQYSGDGKDDGEISSGRSIVQLWSNFLIATDGSGGYEKIAFHVDPSATKDPDRVQFDDPEPVRQEWVDDMGNPVGDDSDMDGSDMTDDDFDMLWNLANVEPSRKDALSNVVALGQRVPTGKPADLDAVLALAGGRVKGHYQHYRGKLVFVKEHESGRAFNGRLSPTEISQALKNGTAEEHSLDQAKKNVTEGNATVLVSKGDNEKRLAGDKSPISELRNHEVTSRLAAEHRARTGTSGSKGVKDPEAKLSPSEKGYLDQFKPRGGAAPSGLRSGADPSGRPARDAAREAQSKADQIAPGKYHTKNGRAVGKAHMVVKEDGSGTYVNSRGEKKELTAAQVKKNHSSGMNHQPDTGSSGSKPEGLQVGSDGKVMQDGKHVGHVVQLPDGWGASDKDGHPVNDQNGPHASKGDALAALKDHLTDSKAPGKAEAGSEQPAGSSETSASDTSADERRATRQARLHLKTGFSRGPNSYRASSREVTLSTKSHEGGGNVHSRKFDSRGVEKYEIPTQQAKPGGKVTIDGKEYTVKEISNHGLILKDSAGDVHSANAFGMDLAGPHEGRVPLIVSHLTNHGGGPSVAEAKPSRKDDGKRTTGSADDVVDKAHAAVNNSTSSLSDSDLHNQIRSAAQMVQSKRDALKRTNAPYVQKAREDLNRWQHRLDILKNERDRRA